MSPKNLITDVAGILVGNAHSRTAKTGVSAIVCETPTCASCHVMGGAPGTRETDLLAPENTMTGINGLFLSGGSAFGLDAGSGIQAWMRKQSIGYAVGDQRIPIVPGAILFDMLNGGDKQWGKYPPYRDLGYEAAATAAADFQIGTAGAGYGATVANLKGGLGSASMTMANGITIGALVAVNALGSPTIASTGHFWAAPFEKNAEFGGLGFPAAMPADADVPIIKFREHLMPATNTTIAVIATDAKLDKAEAKRLAIAAHDGFARALYPVHTPHDGDIVFSLATGKKAKPTDRAEWTDLCAYAAATMSRAIARGIYEATPEKNDIFPCWQEKYGAK